MEHRLCVFLSFVTWCISLCARVCSVCLTDPASCGCCLMQQQIHRMKQFFNASLNELEKELTKTKAVLNNVRGETRRLSNATQKRVKVNTP